LPSCHCLVLRKVKRHVRETPVGPATGTPDRYRFLVSPDSRRPGRMRTCSGLEKNDLSGTLPVQYSALTSVTYMYALRSQNHWSNIYDESAMCITSSLLHVCLDSTTAVARGMYAGLRGWMMSLNMIFDRAPARRGSCIANLSLSCSVRFEGIFVKPLWGPELERRIDLVFSSFVTHAARGACGHAGTSTPTS
jgi:hypothetical protein